MMGNFIDQSADQMPWYSDAYLFREAFCTLSVAKTTKATRTLLNDIDLIVYDMAGTTVQDQPTGKTYHGYGYNYQ